MNILTTWPVLLLVALAVTLTVVVIARRVTEWRLRRAGIDPSSVESPESEELFGSLTSALGEQLPFGEATKSEILKELRLAGHYRPTALREYNAVRFVAVMAVCLCTGFAAVTLPPESTRSVLIIGLGTAALAFGIPRLVLVAQGRRRVQEIVRGLPDAIDLINMGVSRGLPFINAFDRVRDKIREIHPELGRELEIVRQHANVGTLENAWRQLERRVENPEIRSLTGILTQTERLGTNLAAALDNYSASVRVMMKQNAEQAASTAPFKLLFPIVLCMVPAVYMLLLVPAALEMARFMRDRDRLLDRPQSNLARLSDLPSQATTVGGPRP